MKKIFSLLLSALITLIFAVPCFAENDDFISAKAAVVICADTLEVVYAKNANQKLPMASTTKIMTSLLALEYGAGEQAMPVNGAAIGAEGTSIGLKDGDYVSLKTLVKGMLLESGNDAANAAAVMVGGDIPSFVKMMNEKAKQLGMNSTSFETPSGLDGENHYSTAYDMALLGAAAVKNPQFRAVCSSKNETVYYGNPPYKRTFSNHNKLLSYYDGAFGIKTGFTKKSGRCLVSAAEKDGKTLIAVTLNAPDDWNDHIKLYDYSFPQVFSYIFTENLSDLRLSVAGGSKRSISVELSENPLITTVSGNYRYTSKTYLKHFEYAPVFKGDIVGFVEFIDENSKTVIEVPICAAETVLQAVTEESNQAESKKSFWSKIIEFFRR